MKKYLPCMLLCMLTFALLLLTCAKPKDNGLGPLKEIYKSKIAGRVIDKQGNGIKNVSVTTRPDGHTTLTFPDGTFELSGLTAEVSYTLFFSTYDYNDTLVGAPVLKLDDSIPLPGPVKLKSRYSTLKGSVYEDAAKTKIAFGSEVGIEVENQNLSRLVITPSFFIDRVQCPIDGTPVRLLAAKQGLGFGFLDIILPPDTIISNLAVAIDKNGGTVTGTVVENTSAPGSVAKATSPTRPVSGVEVYAFGGALHDITDSQGVYVIHNIPSVGKVVLYFKLNNKIISMIKGVTAPEKGLISMPQLVIGAPLPPKYGFTLTASSITLALNGSTITPRVNVEPVNPSDTIRFARFYWNYDGLPGWDDSTKTSWLDIPAGVFNWKSGETTRPVYCRVRLQDGTFSDSVGTTVVRTIPAQDAPSIVSGVVVDKAGVLLNGVAVNLARAALSDSTRSDGRFIIPTGTLQNAADTLVFLKKGFLTARTPIGSYDTILSTTITMDSVLIPVIETQPVDLFITDSSSAVIVIKASGTGLVYQWQKNDADIPGATDSSYMTPIMRVSDSGTTYRCIISNIAGSVVSNRAVLHVSAGIIPPAIQSHPRDTTIADSATASFSVTATGSSLSYQWQKNDIDIAGAIGSSYTTPVMRVKDSGSTYRCIISNAKGSDTTIRALLKVTTRPPLVITGPKSLSVTERDSVLFSVSVSGTAPFNYQWYMTNQNMVTSAIKTATQADYRFTAAYADSGTRFYCIITNAAGKDTSSTAILSVKLAPPLVTLNPRDTSVYSGDLVTFSISAVSSAAMTYQWQRTDTNSVTVAVARATAATYSVSPRMLLNRMRYRCIAINPAGSDTSLQAQLIVTPAGMKLIPAANKSFTAGGLTHLSMAGGPILDTSHLVTFTKDFLLDSTEVTQKDFLALMSVNPAMYSNSTANPVEQVTWFDAALYCNARSRYDGLDTVYRYTAVTGTPGNGASALTNLQIIITANGYRLPTEAEWEYACHGGTTTTYWWGADTNGAGTRVWSALNSANSTRPVASTIANGYKLFDMSGNVNEWCNDWLGVYTGTPLTNPAGPGSGNARVVRGGSIGDRTFDPNFRPQYRASTAPGSVAVDVGFRCVLPR